MAASEGMPIKGEAIRASSRGFTYIEMIIVIAVIGLLMMTSYSSFTNTLETRALDNTASEILMAMQTAKWQAAGTKLNHRVRFSDADGSWTFRIERESTSGTWTILPGTIPKRISSKFDVTLSLPSSQDIIFLATGFVSNYQSTKNSITLASPKLRTLNQPSQRMIRFLVGGSVQFLKS